MPTVRFEVADGIATITLDRPGSLNALTTGMMDELGRALRYVDEHEDVRVVVLTGAGRGFCSGADLSGLSGTPSADSSPGGAPATPTAETPAGPDIGVFTATMRALAELPVPTIARVQGVAAGGGVGLALGCDITIAARSASFVCTFGPKLGIVPDLGTTWHLARRIGRARALAISMLGAPVSAEQAASWGLIWAVVDDDQLDDQVHSVAAQLARSSPEAMRRIRHAIDAAPANSFADQMDLELEHQAVLIPRNMAEGAAAFMERRDPIFDPRRH